MSEDNLITLAASSIGDPMAITEEQQESSASDNLQTSSDYSTVCDVTMGKAGHKEMFKDDSGLDYLVKCTESSHSIDIRRNNIIVQFNPLFSGRKVNYISSENTDLLKNTAEDNDVAKLSPSLELIMDEQTEAVPPVLESNGNQSKPLTALHTEFEAKIKELTSEIDSLLQRETTLMQQINQKTVDNKKMCNVMEEYEKFIIALIEEMLISKEAQDKLIMEKNQACEHLSSMESSFNDLLAKFEKCKLAVYLGKQTEDMLIQKLDEYERGIKKHEERYNKLKQVTTESLTKANEYLENEQKKYNDQVNKLNATIWKRDITISSLRAKILEKEKQNRK